MRILSIDPGVETGFAVIEDDVLDLSMTARREKVLRNGFFNHLILLSKPDVVLLEDFPKLQPDVEQVAFVTHIHKWFKNAGYRIEMIRPVNWKNLVTRVEITSTHARDAATMAMWWIENEARKTNGQPKRERHSSGNL